MSETQQTPDPRRRGLGRGLNALFEDEETSFDSASAATDGVSPVVGPRQVLGLDQMEPGPYQPRSAFDKDGLEELAESIATHGVLQPIVVRPRPGAAGLYEIVAGERRWRAAQMAQLHEVPVVIRDLDDRAALEIALIENLQRRDLNAVEEALGYRRLMEEFGHTQEQAAAVLGKSRSHVANTIRLLTLPPRVIDMLRDGRLTAGHARTLVTAPNAEELADRIVGEGLSVRAAEQLGAGKAAARSGPAKKPEKDVDTLALEEDIGNALGMKVTIAVRSDARGGTAGSLKIDFKTLDDLDALLHRMGCLPDR